MLMLIDLLDAVERNWPNDSPRIQYFTVLRKRLAKAAVRAGHNKVGIVLPRESAKATACTLLDLLADPEMSAAIGYNHFWRIKPTLHALIKLLPGKRGKRERKDNLVDDTALWRRKQRLKLGAKGLLL